MTGEETKGKRVWRLSEFIAPAEGTAVALGFFDGYHKGHQRLVATTTTLAEQQGLVPLVFTFRNHPKVIVDSKRAPELLTCFSERVELLLHDGVDMVWCEFDRPFSLMEPEDFVRGILRERLNARVLVSGPNYRFGHRARGNTTTLCSLGTSLGMQVVQVEPVYLEGALVSSSRIRMLVREGRVGLAAGLMGRPYVIGGLIERGEERGRRLGFPTANMSLPRFKVQPLDGVYAVRVILGEDTFGGVANLGTRPTFKGKRRLLEVHILDFCRDLYGAFMKVQFVKRLRDEMIFPRPEALKEAIAKDIEAARRVLG